MGSGAKPTLHKLQKAHTHFGAPICTVEKKIPIWWIRINLLYRFLSDDTERQHRMDINSGIVESVLAVEKKTKMADNNTFGLTTGLIAKLLSLNDDAEAHFIRCVCYTCTCDTFSAPPQKWNNFFFSSARTLMLQLVIEIKRIKYKHYIILFVTVNAQYIPGKHLMGSERIHFPAFSMPSLRTYGHFNAYNLVAVCSYAHSSHK